jgi:hypothetical protein
MRCCIASSTTSRLKDKHSSWRMMRPVMQKNLAGGDISALQIARPCDEGRARS